MEATLNLVNEFDLPSMLNDLKRTLSRLRTETKAVSEREPPKLERLQKVIARYSDKVGRENRLIENIKEG